jgi:hypothetical protein
VKLPELDLQEQGFQQHSAQSSTRITFRVSQDLFYGRIEHVRLHHRQR